MYRWINWCKLCVGSESDISMYKPVKELVEGGNIMRRKSQMNTPILFIYQEEVRHYRAQRIIERSCTSHTIFVPLLGKTRIV